MTWPQEAENSGEYSVQQRAGMMNPTGKHPERLTGSGTTANRCLPTAASGHDHRRSQLNDTSHATCERGDGIANEYDPAVGPDLGEASSTISGASCPKGDGSLGSLSSLVSSSATVVGSCHVNAARYWRLSSRRASMLAGHRGSSLLQTRHAVVNRSRITCPHARRKKKKRPPGVTRRGPRRPGDQRGKHAAPALVLSRRGWETHA